MTKRSSSETKRHLTLAVGTVVALTAVPGAALALAPGDKVTSAPVRDGNDKPARIPDLGKKVLAIFYTDPDVKDQNEPFRELLKAAKLDQSKYRGLGVVNLKDTWKPNFIIRKVVRDKVKKYHALILTDPNHTVQRYWRLGDCNEKDVVIIVGKDARAKLVKMGKMSPAEMKAGLSLIKKLMKE